MATVAVRYTPRASRSDPAPFLLVAEPGTASEARFPLHDQIEIGRDDGRSDAAGTILIADSRVSRRHCVVSCRSDGRCWIRDTSRNGTRIDGRRLVPNVECELRSGQIISVTSGVDLVLASAAHESAPEPKPADVAEPTVPAGALTVATLLVGDIRDYTVLVRRVPSAVLQQSVSRVFELLSDAVGHFGGTVKEYQGDALVAFWDGANGEQTAAMACHAALELDRRARHLATDRSVWRVEDFRLEMDWALATGPVMIDAFGGEQRAGLSMIGEPIVLAFRLEKFATAETGRILACPATRQLACPRFQFRHLGEMLAKGFSRPDQVFALERELADCHTEVG